MARRPAGEAETTILKLLLAADRPLGGHAIVRLLMANGTPIRAGFVFRMLHKLVAKRLAHRVELLSAFAPGAPGREIHLICQYCGSHATVASSTVAHELNDVAARHAFAPSTFVLEASGRCRRCHAAAG